MIERLTISVSRCGRIFVKAEWNPGPDRQRRQRAWSKRLRPGQGRKQHNATVAILDIGGMNDGVEQQTQRIYENVALLALDLLPAS